MSYISCQSNLQIDSFPGNEKHDFINRITVPNAVREMEIALVYCHFSPNLNARNKVILHNLKTKTGIVAEDTDNCICIIEPDTKLPLRLKSRVFYPITLKDRATEFHISIKKIENTQS